MTGDPRGIVAAARQLGRAAHEVYGVHSGGPPCVDTRRDLVGVRADAKLETSRQAGPHRSTCGASVFARAPEEQHVRGGFWLAARGRTVGVDRNSRTGLRKPAELDALHVICIGVFWMLA